jgi:hypothetical protein
MAVVMLRRQFLIRMPQAVRPIFESNNFHRARVPMLRQFRHLPGELGCRDRLPAILLIPDSVERQHMPAVRSQPCFDVLICPCNLPAVHREPIQRTLPRIVRTLRSPTRLLVARADYGVPNGLGEVVKRITVRKNLHFQPTFNPSLGILRFELRIVVQLRSPMIDAVGPDFMSPSNHASEQPDVLFTPVGLRPIWMFATIRVDRVCVRDQEERSRETILFEDRNGSLKLASQSVVESKRNECRFIHIVLTQLCWPVLSCPVSCCPVAV